jgi:hypothetical protein
LRRLGQLFRPTRAHLRRARRPAAFTLLIAAGLLSLMSVLALVGSWRDDVAIGERTGRATAEVLSVSATRTVIKFSTADGTVVVPERGVFYPSGLEPHQLVRVEYDTANPDTVRVAGRTVRLGLLPAALLIMASWAVVVPIVLWLWFAGHGVRPEPATHDVPGTPDAPDEPDPVTT